MSDTNGSASALQSLMAQWIQLHPVDQDMVLKALPREKALSLQRQLMAGSESGANSFAALIEPVLTSQAENFAAEPADIQPATKLKLDLLPLGVVATLLVDLAPQERVGWVEQFAPDRRNRLNALVQTAASGRLRRSSSALRTLLTEVQSESSACPAKLYAATSQGTDTAVHVFTPLKRLRSWLRV